MRLPLLVLCILCISTLGFDNGAEYDFYSDENDQFQAIPSGVTDLTPIRAVATFFNSSTFGFWSGTAQGNVSFYQANFPNHQATVINVALEFPPSEEDRFYKVEVLFSGDLDARYCLDGKRFVDIHSFKLPAGQSWHLASIKRYDVSVTNEVETVVGRALRVVCRKCRRRVDQMAGCSVIGRAEDEAYFEHPQQNAIPPSLGDFPPGSKLFVRNPLKVFRRHH
uniref:LAM_G_DOMAIN domain-containing protein n=1 Tax=Steinernema glaseri TaxID=37863 RepID=A0A1I7YGE3_9BILA